MTTWTTIFPDVDGPPVRGRTSELIGARTFFRQLADDSGEIVRQFARFTGDGQATGSLEGDAAVAFGRFIQEVDASLAELPEVAERAADILDHHVSELGTLWWRAERATDSALARARTAWTARNDLEESAERIRASHQAIMRQIGELDAADDGSGATAPERDQLDRDRGRTADSLRLTEQAIAHQDSVLHGIRDEWTELRAAERDLDETTADDLLGIRLGDLEDPGWFERAVHAAFDLVIDIGTIAIGVLCPIVGLALLYDGDWAALLWDLKEVLDVVLVVAGVVALLFPLSAPFMVAIFALTALALAVTTALYVTQAPNPQTGETAGLDDVLWSAAGVALGARGASAAFRAARGLPTTFTPMSGITAMRTNVTNWRAVLTGGENATGAARSLGIRMLPLAPSTPLRQAIPAVLGSRGALLALVTTGNTVRGHVDRPGAVLGLPDSVGRAVRLDPAQGPTTEVFTGIAHRQRFNPPMHWNHPSLPTGQRLEIVPAR